jgi:hypothetical protein
MPARLPDAARYMARLAGSGEDSYPVKGGVMSTGKYAAHRILLAGSKSYLCNS